MKGSYVKTAILGVLSAALLGGCSKEKADGFDAPQTGKVAVVMNGGIKDIAPPESTRAVIDPQNGLPPIQLDVNIITVNYTTGDPLTDWPGPDAWRGQTADVTRGFFGENETYTSTVNNDNPLSDEEDRIAYPPTNGRIEYTDEGGTAVQKVFLRRRRQILFREAVLPL